MSRKSGLLGEELVALAQCALKKLGKNSLITRKLYAIISAQKHGITEVAKINDISRTTLTQWIHRFKKSGIVDLKSPESRRRKSILDSSDREYIACEIKKNPQITIDHLVEKIIDQRGKKVSRSTMHREVKKMKFSYITPRPVHYKQDEIKVEEFKKKY